MEDKYLSVLLIEDNVYDVRFLRRTLLREPLIELEQVDTLIDAVARVKKGGIDLILLDLSLRDSQGVDTFDLLFREVSSLPIVVLTGYNDEDLAIKTLRHGAQDYLVKGMVDTGSLVRAMRYAIERKHAEIRHNRSQEELDTLSADLEKVKVSEEYFKSFEDSVLPALAGLERELQAFQKRLELDSNNVDQLKSFGPQLAVSLNALQSFLTNVKSWKLKQ